MKKGRALYPVHRAVYARETYFMFGRQYAPGSKARTSSVQLETYLMCRVGAGSQDLPEASE